MITKRKWRLLSAALLCWITGALLALAFVQIGHTSVVDPAGNPFIERAPIQIVWVGKRKLGGVQLVIDRDVSTCVFEPAQGMSLTNVYRTGGRSATALVAISAKGWPQGTVLWSCLASTDASIFVVEAIGPKCFRVNSRGRCPKRAKRNVVLR